MATLDPPSAVAAAKCLIARDPRRSLAPPGSHPVACLWDEWETPVLLRMVEDFNLDAGYDPDRDRFEDEGAERFRRLPRERQREMVRMAQYGDPGVSR